MGGRSHDSTDLPETPRVTYGPGASGVLKTG